jgi:hypothetical protein
VIPYLAVMVPIFFVLAISINIPLPNQRRIGYYCVLCLTALSGLRGYVGTDTYTYHIIYLDSLLEGWKMMFTQFEPLFVIAIKMCGFISNSPFVFIVLISLIQGYLLMKIVKECNWPMGFMLIYTSMFYLNFEFNILRAGMAILLFGLASLEANRRKSSVFYVLGIASVLTHYSLAIAFLPMVIAREKGFAGKIISMGCVLCGVWVAYSVLANNSVMVDKLILYVTFVGAGDSIVSAMGIALRILLYLLILICVIRRDNWMTKILVFSAWIVLRLATIKYMAVDRIEVIVNFIFILSAMEISVDGWRKRYRNILIIAIAGLSLLGNFKGLTSAEDSASRGQILDENHLKSPFLPYRFIWEE